MHQERPTLSKTKRKKLSCTVFHLLAFVTSLFVFVIWIINSRILKSAVESSPPRKQELPLVRTPIRQSNGNPWKAMKGSPDQSDATVVTGYFELPSKYASDNYLGWMKNMLSLQDAMVVFTSQKYVSVIEKFRSHAPTKTVIVEMDIDKVPLATDYSTEFWQHQWDIDPEKRIHRSYQLFWVWLSKTWFVNQAIQHDPFRSNIFIWSDIGCFRNGKYNGKQMMQHPEVLSRNAILQMAHHAPKPPPVLWWNDKRQQRDCFYHSGSQMAGYKDTWMEFQSRFDAVVKGFVERDMFMGEDQAVLQSTCLQNPNLCEYIPFNQIPDNHYFGLRHALHYGGNYTKWSPPPVNATQLK